VQPQLIQNLEGGIVKDIFVSEGEEVSVGQRVATMDTTAFQSSYQELQAQRVALDIRLARLAAEREPGSILTLAADLHNEAPEITQSEEALLQARAIEFQDTVSALQRSLTLQRDEVSLLEPIVESGSLPRIELIRAEQTLADIERQYLTYTGQFQTDRSEKYADALTQLRQIEQQIRAREDQLRRADLTSPVRGEVNQILITTLGGVVNPGEPVMEIIPLDDNLIVEGRISPKDAGFIFVGMPATIKLTAFDFAIYGTLSGSVIHIGADTVIDETDRNATPYYAVLIALDGQILSSKDGDVEIRPGMQATVELESGTKTVLEYLLKPLFRATEAFSER
jgi:adhesin transport system membrane fusion protein